MIYFWVRYVIEEAMVHLPAAVAMAVFGQREEATFGYKIDDPPSEDP